MTDSRSADLIRVTGQLADAVDALNFAAPVAHIYNPLRYAWPSHRQYLDRFGWAPGRILLLGMNPGPFGMAQTGIPFGDVGMVRDWMGISAAVSPPARQHPKRPIQGFDCARSEVSGRRLWGWAQQLAGSAERFFTDYFVLNYCPLVFMHDSGRNLTPDKLPPCERDSLYRVCDAALREAIAALQPRALVGIGRFAATRLQRALPNQAATVLTAPHPSPASPLANRGWAPLMDAALAPLLGTPAAATRRSIS